VKWTKWAKKCNEVHPFFPSRNPSAVNQVDELSFFRWIGNVTKKLKNETKRHKIIISKTNGQEIKRKISENKSKKNSFFYCLKCIETDKKKETKRNHILISRNGTKRKLTWNKTKKILRFLTPNLISRPQYIEIKFSFLKIC